MPLRGWRTLKIKTKVRTSSRRLAIQGEFDLPFECRERHLGRSRSAGVRKLKAADTVRDFAVFNSELALTQADNRRIGAGSLQEHHGILLFRKNRHARHVQGEIA